MKWTIEACIANARRATNGSPDPLAFTSELPNISCAGINKRLAGSLHLGFSVLLVATAMFATGAAAEETTWKAGIAKARITPRESRWMSGYGHRMASDPLHDIWIKVLALESADGHRAVVITSDVCGFSKVS